MAGKKPPTLTEVGVIIGRFQSTELTRAHRSLFEAVFAQHKKVIVLLGVNPVKISRNNPLDYMTRELMIKSAYPRAVVMPLKDVPGDDGLWSANVDYSIELAISDLSVTLYGSRDSFVPSYSGRYKTQVMELPVSHEISATASREAASKEVRKEKAFRIGVIYASYNRYPISYQAVDAVVWRHTRTESPVLGGTMNSSDLGVEILLGRKNTDPEGTWRFPGGFVQPEDESLEMAAKREAGEEIGDVALHEAVYLFSDRVNDPRYRKEKDKIMTAVYAMQYFYGKEEPSDDLDHLRWVKIDFDKDNVKEILVEEHAPLWGRVRAHFEPPKATN